MSNSAENARGNRKPDGGVLAPAPETDELHEQDKTPAGGGSGQRWVFGGSEFESPFAGLAKPTGSGG